MKKYENMDNFKERKHTLEITLQIGEHKGTLQKDIDGNCFGLNILHCFDIDSMEDTDFEVNEIGFEVSDDDEGIPWFSCNLKDENGVECFVEDELRQLENYIVKLEIVDCVIL